MYWDPWNQIERRPFLKAALGSTLTEFLAQDVAQAGEKPRTVILFDDIYLQHDTGPGHSEAPGRCQAIMKPCARPPSPSVSAR